MTEQAFKPHYKRSADRCHLISRLPVFDARGNCSLYALRFTKGNMFVVDELDERHILHVLTGFMIRRDISSFVGSDSSVMINLPLSQELLKFFDKIPTSRLVIRLNVDEESTVSSQHLLRTLNHLHVRFAIELDNLIASSWRYCINSFAYVIIDIRDEHYTEKLMLYKQLKKNSPWLKLIVRCYHMEPKFFDRIGNSEADLCISNAINPALGGTIKEVLDRHEPIRILLIELTKPWPDLATVVSISTTYPKLVRVFNICVEFMRQRRKIADPITNPRLAEAAFGPEVVFSIFCFALIYQLVTMCEQTNRRGEQSNYAMEPFKNSIIRGFFLYYMLRERACTIRTQFLGFRLGVFSLLHDVCVAGNIKIEGAASMLDNQNPDIETCKLLIEACQGFEQVDLKGAVEASLDLKQSIGTMLRAYEKSVVQSASLCDMIFKGKPA